MTNIEKIIDKFDVELRPGYLSDSSQHIIKIMKEYAKVCMTELIDEIHYNGVIDDNFGDGYLILNSDDLIQKIIDEHI